MGKNKKKKVKCRECGCPDWYDSMSFSPARPNNWMAIRHCYACDKYATGVGSTRVEALEKAEKEWGRINSVESEPCHLCDSKNGIRLSDKVVLCQDCQDAWGEGYVKIPLKG